MKFFNLFLLLWVIFALLDPDPDSEYGFGSETLEKNAKILLKMLRFLLLQGLCVLIYVRSSPGR
jgi:hypothetical protein